MSRDWAFLVGDKIIPGRSEAGRDCLVVGREGRGRGLKGKSQGQSKEVKHVMTFKFRMPQNVS